MRAATSTRYLDLIGYVIRFATETVQGVAHRRLGVGVTVKYQYIWTINSDLSNGSTPRRFSSNPW